jgi:hypothetical protein
MIPLMLSSPQSISSSHSQQQQHQQQQQQVPSIWRSRESVLSASPFQQQQLQQQQQQQQLNHNNQLFNSVQRLSNDKYNTSTSGRGLGFMKSRFYSASSEMVNNNNNNNNNNNSNINYLVSPPPHYPSQLKRFSPFFSQSASAQQQTIPTHKSLENLDGNSSTRNFGGSPNPPPFSHQKRRRPLYSHNNPYSGTNKDESGFNGVPVSRGCVYLRPEQNIPDVFSTAFKPINENNLSKVGDDDDDENDRQIGESNPGQDSGSSEQTISRDDIVVTMRSVNV